MNNQTTPKVTLIAYTPEPEKVIAMSAKLCYSKSNIDELMKNLTNNNVNEFLEKLLDLNHTSPLEHVNFTFGIEGISRACSHQLVRHRIASYSQQSQRYVDLSKAFKYIIPPSISEIPQAKKVFEKAMKHVYDAYKEIAHFVEENELIKIIENDQNLFDIIASLASNHVYLKDINSMSAIINHPAVVNPKKDDKIAKSIKDIVTQYRKRAKKVGLEDGRFVLPNACETKIIVSMNIRSLLNFFAHRDCKRAQWEIREVANQMLSIVKEISGTLFKKAGAQCRHDKCPEKQMTCGNPYSKK